MGELRLLQRRAYLGEAAAFCGVSYHTPYRAACREDLKVLAGMGRMMVSEAELNRFLNQTKMRTPKPRKRRPSTDGLELPS